MNKIPVERLCERFGTGHFLLMIGLGFDQRSLVALSHFPRVNTVKIAGISNVGWSNFNQNSIDKFKELAGDKGLVLGTKADSIINVADEILRFLDEYSKSTTSLVIDITSLSHELLVVLLGILYKMQIINKTVLLYVSASEYSVWLSRGVRSIRSILGFPGMMLPSKKLHLVILAGFEVERASELIVRCEPASISIGVGKREQSISEAHHDKNKLSFERLDQFVKSIDFDSQEVYPFEFSCVDPVSTKNQLFSHIDDLQLLNDRNIVICPLNTKLSTVGVALAAFERPEIQICYAEPDEYNVNEYCKPGKDVTIISFIELYS